MAAQANSNKAVWGWCLYDFANSPFTTLVVTFIYATYFTQVIAEDQGETWSRGVIITALTVALLSPFMGAMADRGGYRKKFLFIATGIGILATCGLFTALPGQTVQALTLFVVANVAFEMGMVFYNAFLPEIVKPDQVGRVSGYGWGLGYVGGLLALVLALVGFVLPDQPWFGLSKELGENIRATNLMVAAWFLVFSLPLFLWVKERPVTAKPGGKIIGDTLRQLRTTFTEMRRYRQIIRFLLARLFFNDGLITVFAFGGIYAAVTFDFTAQEILIFGIVLNLSAGAGAFGMGFMDDKLGGKKTLQVSLYGLIVATVLAVFAPNKATFWVAGILVGAFSGPNQSASRSLMARFVPPEKENEFFGFFAFSGKATAFLGPALFGSVTALMGSQRYGLGVILLLFVIGLVLLFWVDETEGKRMAKAGNTAP